MTMTTTPDPATRPPEPARHLIAGDRVIGTEVRRPDGTRVGRIERPMLDTVSGRVAYAVMSLGGFLGLGEDDDTLPWSVLGYDPALDADRVDLTEEQVKTAPAPSLEGGDPADERQWEEHVHRYDNAAPYRGV